MSITLTVTVTLATMAIPSLGIAQTVGRRRTGFSSMWSNYPGAMTATEVYRLIGGRVLQNHLDNPDGFQNSCALRLSRALNYGGYPLPYTRGQTGSGADGLWYFYRVSDIERQVRSRFGSPDDTAATQQEVDGKKGIILFGTCGWTDATGHIDLWNGAACGDHCYWEKCPTVSFWRFEQ
jgi:hypothetical protein